MAKILIFISRSVSLTDRTCGMFHMYAGHLSPDLQDVRIEISAVRLSKTFQGSCPTTCTSTPKGSTLSVDAVTWSRFVRAGQLFLVRRLSGEESRVVNFHRLVIKHSRIMINRTLVVLLLAVPRGVGNHSDYLPVPCSDLLKLSLHGIA